MLLPPVCSWLYSGVRSRRHHPSRNAGDFALGSRLSHAMTKFCRIAYTLWTRRDFIMTWDTINVTSVGRSATGAPNNQTEGPLRKTPRHLEAPCISAPRFGFRMARGPVRARVRLVGGAVSGWTNVICFKYSGDDAFLFWHKRGIYTYPFK